MKTKIFNVNLFGKTYSLGLGIGRKPFTILFQFDTVNWKELAKKNKSGKLDCGKFEKSLVQKRLCESADKLLERCIDEAPDEYTKDKVVENYRKLTQGEQYE